MYDPVVGRWLSTDPYKEFASPYVAMGNNPVNAVDPTGGFTGGGDPNGPGIKVGIGPGSDSWAYATGGDPYASGGSQFDSFTQALIAINEFNPLAVAVNAVSGFITGEDINGMPHSTEDALIAINEWNPLANAVNGISVLATGYDINGREMSGLQPGFLILGAMGGRGLARWGGNLNVGKTQLSLFSKVTAPGMSGYRIVGVKYGKFQAAIDYHDWVLRSNRHIAHGFGSINKKFWHYHWGPGKTGAKHMQIGTGRVILDNSQLRNGIFGNW